MNLLLVMLITTLAITQNSCRTVTSHAVCSETEKETLLTFKSGLVDPSNRLASWVRSGNCCHWAGIVCHNLTGYVLELHLRGNLLYPDYSHYLSSASYDNAIAAFKRSCLGGKISNSLLNLRHLHYLDLSNNDFQGIQIPDFFGSIQSLRHLNLSSAGFGGMVPLQLGNLSNLLYLNIGYEGRYESYIENFRWLSGLSKLKHLDLSNVDLSKASNWLEQTNMLSSLKELHLQNCRLEDVPQLPYMINSSGLEILDLSWNQISSCSFLKMFYSLVSLNLGWNSIKGPIPRVLLNLTSLRDLDLTWNMLNSSLPSWMWSFSQLEKLILNGVPLKGDVSDVVGNLTSLTYLDLSDTSLEFKVKGPMRTLCNLQWVDLSSLSLEQGLLTTFLGCSFNRLQHLSLQGCKLSGPIPKFIGSLPSLNHLDLSHNQLNGFIPEFIRSLTSLYHLDLSYNELNGSIPEFIGLLTSLNHLDLSDNQLTGMIPTSLSQMIQLELLNLNDNFLEGTMTEDFFANLTKLQVFTASHNQIALNVGPSWIPPFQLTTLGLSSWQLDAKFPEWLHSQYHLLILELDCTGLKDRVPTWFWDRSSQFYFVNLSSNGLHGEVSKGTIFVEELDLSSNNFEGLLPSFSTNSSYLDLSDNLFSGSISQFLCYKKDKLKRLKWMVLGNNQLSGAIPNCWESWKTLLNVDLNNNNFTGSIPDSIGSLGLLGELHMQMNNLSGELPLSLKNCTELIFLDIGENNFGGSLPTWIGEGFIGMRFIRLRSNNFEGNIPNELCALRDLQILDIADNKLSGHIPKCIFNFSVMADKRTIGSSLAKQEHSNFGSSPTIFLSGESVNLVNKGNSLEYTSILPLVVTIDLSNNNLSGQIPEEITNLVALISLNLSGNMLGGRIPEHMGNMSSLESLDLSFNRLSGEIPQSMATMTALNYLNLSYNNLTGTIPTSTQFSTFGRSSFLGNNLSTTTTQVSNNNSRKESDIGNRDRHWVEFEEFYVSMVVGFVVAFGVVVAPLLYSQSWRLVYFRTINRILDRLWVLAVLPIRVRFRRQV